MFHKVFITITEKHEDGSLALAVSSDGRTTATSCIIGVQTNLGKILGRTDPLLGKDLETNHEYSRCNVSESGIFYWVRPETL
jgi:hypothetical protein